MGSLSLLQGIFPTQGSNPGLPKCRWILYQLRHNNSRCLICLVTQLCLTLCDPMDCSLPCSSVHGIFQARILEWAAISYSRGSFPPGAQTHVSCVFSIARRLFFFFKPLCHLCLPLVFNQVINHIREKAGAMIYELKDKCMTLIFSGSSAVLKYKRRKLFRGILNSY